MIGYIDKNDKTATLMGFDKFSSRATRRHIARAARRRARHITRRMLRQIGK